jgi:small subunit ribosomal protein S6|tara:strand:- start:2412 stop:2714 length:303 start_codon:yes stop_codon:yes gene_type:complete
VKRIYALKQYELVIVISPEIDQENSDKIIDNLSNLITSNDGTIEDLDRWGIRKLAYPINKFREGNYVSSLVNIDPSKVTTIEGSIRSNEDILRHLLTLKD